jgi:hypothetical protein
MQRSLGFKVETGHSKRDTMADDAKLRIVSSDSIRECAGYYRWKLFMSASQMEYAMTGNKDYGDGSRLMVSIEQ